MRSATAPAAADAKDVLRRGQRRIVGLRFPPGLVFHLRLRLSPTLTLSNLQILFRNLPARGHAPLRALCDLLRRAQASRLVLTAVTMTPAW